MLFARVCWNPAVGYARSRQIIDPHGTVDKEAEDDGAIVGTRQEAAIAMMQSTIDVLIRKWLITERRATLDDEDCREAISQLYAWSGAPAPAAVELLTLDEAIRTVVSIFLVDGTAWQSDEEIRSGVRNRLAAHVVGTEAVKFQRRNHPVW